MGLERTVKQVLRKYADKAYEEIRDIVVAGSAQAPTPAPTKRTSVELARVADRVHRHLTRHPGIGIEELARGMRTETRTLTLPLRMLQEAGRVTSDGTKRAMKYTAVAS